MDVDMKRIRGLFVASTSWDFAPFDEGIKRIQAHAAGEFDQALADYERIIRADERRKVASEIDDGVATPEEIQNSPEKEGAYWVEDDVIKAIEYSGPLTDWMRWSAKRIEEGK